MCGVMAHRGPDDEGVYIGDGVAIGMRRLSIIDLSNGFQPISNEDGTVKGVAKLEPARIAVGTQGRNLRIERYWDVDFLPNERASEAEFVDELRERLAEAVTLHQVSDVPVGAFLSGGLDSSAVVAM